jgi:3-methyl-2-oxobutanoate hydroxymethyltransferase
VNKTMRKTIPEIRARKSGIPLVCLTAYTAPFARILDEFTDILLVGDSLGMVLYGMESTLGVTVDMMVNHGRAVVSSTQNACVVVDMPFGSYQASPEKAFENAARIMAETGCSAVKLEGGAEMAETIHFLTQRAIPVIGHIGLMPQHVHTMGGYRYQGRGNQEKERITGDAETVEQAGASAIVLEGITEPLARMITEHLTIPTIGIGASSACDGQILVTEDMAGLFSTTPKFVKRFGALEKELAQAAKAYAEEVQTRQFPSLEHCFGVKG